MKALILSFFIRLYPMFWLNGIILGKWSNQYKQLRVYLIRQPLNLNGAFSIFGGSIASAADPFLPLMYKLHMQEKGINISVWTKSVAVKFIKPIHGKAYFDYVITAEEISKALEQMRLHGKYVETHQVKCEDAKGNVYAIADVQTYMKLLSK